MKKILYLILGLVTLYPATTMSMEPEKRKNPFNKENSNKKQKLSNDVSDDRISLNEVEKQAFFDTIKYNDLETLQELLKREPQYARALHTSSYTTTWEDIEGNIETHTRTIQYLPLEYAIVCNNTEAFQLLMSQKPAAAELHSKTYQLLYTAIHQKNLAIFKAIAENKEIKFDVKWKNNDGNSLLHYAYQCLASDIVSYLLDQGANQSIENKHNEIPAHSLIYNSNEQEITDFLRVTETDTESCNSQQQTLLHQAIFMANIDCVKALIQLGANVNAQDSSGATPAHYLANKIHLLEQFNEDTTVWELIESAKEVATLLVVKGANINIKDNDNASPLEYVAHIETTDELAQHLIKLGANTEIIDKISLRQDNPELSRYIDSYESFVEMPKTYIPYIATYNNKEIQEVDQKDDQLEIVELSETEKKALKTKDQFLIQTYPQQYWFKVANCRGTTYYIDLINLYNQLKNTTIFVGKKEISQLSSCLNRLNFLESSPHEQIWLQKSGIPLTNNEDSYKALLARSKNNNIYTDTIIKYQ